MLLEAFFLLLFNQKSWKNVGKFGENWPKIWGVKVENPRKLNKILFKMSLKCRKLIEEYAKMLKKM